MFHQVIGRNEALDGEPVKWDILDRWGAINDCFFKWANQGQNATLRDQIWQMWDGKAGPGLKQYLQVRLVKLVKELNYCRYSCRRTAGLSACSGSPSS